MVRRRSEWSLSGDDFSRALLLIARGGGLREVAEHHGVAISTVKRFLSRQPEYAEAVQARKTVARNHGSYITYCHGCRCIDCRDDQWRQARKIRSEKRQDINHGTISGYQYFGCRCEKCLGEYHRQSHEKNEASRETATRHRQIWTDAEMKVIEDNPDKPDSEIAQMVGRTIASVRCRRYIMKTTMV